MIHELLHYEKHARMEEIKRLESRIAALEAENAALREDAERWRRYKKSLSDANSSGAIFVRLVMNPNSSGIGETVTSERVITLEQYKNARRPEQIVGMYTEQAAYDLLRFVAARKESSNG